MSLKLQTMLSFDGM
jgi:hypothetical protein